MQFRKILLAVPNAIIWCLNIGRYMLSCPPPCVGPADENYDFDKDIKYLK